MMIMGKRFIKFRVPSFKSCRSKHLSSLPFNPVPSFLRLSPAPKQKHYSAPPPPSHNNKPHHTHYSLKRHVSSALASARRSFSSKPRNSHEDSHTQSSTSSNFKWEKQGKWHVIAKVPDYNYDSTPPRRKIYTSAAEDEDKETDVVLFPPLNLKRRRSKRRRRTFQSNRASTSSDSGIFSEETETLVCSTDSSSPRRAHVKEPKTRKSHGGASPARLSEFMRKAVPCRDVAVEGKVRESFAVVKRSEDPYEDFKGSMAEMVVEKQMFERRELEEMLRCFLSLNSADHHAVIVRAFVDIWESLFCPSPLSSDV